MPTRIHPPACLLEVFDDYIYPTIDFSRVAFFTGMPVVLGLGSQKGLTLPAAGFTSQINVYLREGAYDPCNFEDFLLMAHELVHVLQIQQSLLGGMIPGLSVGKYVGCWLGWFGNGTDCDNGLEREAYEWANGCPPLVNGGLLRSGLTAVGLAQPPCDCSDAPWYREALAQGKAITFSTELAGADPADLVLKYSDIELWRCLLSPWALIAALVVGIVWGIGSIILQAVRSIIGWVGGLFGKPKSWIWFTAFDATTDSWFIPDVPVTKNDHTKTSAGPALAVYNGLLYMAYKSGGDNDIWYNYFDGHNWLDQDIEITKDGHTQTSAGPALAVYNGLLYMAYKSGGDNDIWYNYFDGHNWLDQDIEITKDGHTQTSAGPALAVYNGLLYMAYKSGGDNHIWYNYFDGHNWLDQDIEITKDGHTQTSAGPALAVYNGLLYMAYKSGGDNDIWYNYFDGHNWLDQDIEITKDGHTQTSAGPALAVYNGLLYMAYKSGGDDDIWYNLFDGEGWGGEDSKITRYGSVYTGEAPALAGFGKLLYLIYRDNS